MTSKQTPTPFDVRNSTTMTPTSSTPISRMLYLRSDQATNSYGPTDKAWMISQMETRGKFHNLVVRSLQILHLFPNVRETVLLDTGTKTVTIPAGNYAPAQIARYINDKLYPEVQTVCYDPQSLAFRFCPGIDIVGATTTAAEILGFRPGVNYHQATESVLPVQLSGPRRIIVDSNLQLYNIPVSGRLAVIPVTKSYGEVIHYDNFASTYNHLCMDQHFQSIRITLTDEFERPLGGVDEQPWDILISFEPMNNPGFQEV